MDLNAPFEQPGTRRERRRTYMRKIDAYIDRVKGTGRKDPESGIQRGYPHLVKIAGERGVPYESLRRKSPIRHRLDEAIEELGMGVCAYGEVWDSVSYQQ